MSNFNFLHGLKIAAIFTAVAALSACGGGGGGGTTGTSPATLTYSGNTSPASITGNNATLLVSSVFGSSETGPNVSIQSVSQQSAVPGEQNTNFDLTGLAKKIRQQLPQAIAQAGNNRQVYRPASSSITINEQQPCDSGTLRLDGTLSDAGTGTLNVDFLDCILDGSQYSGRARLVINAFDINYAIFTDASFEFDSLTVQDSPGNTSLAGSMRMQTSLSTNTEVLTLNLVIRDNNTGRLTKTENLVISTTYDSVLFPSRYQESIDGRVYDSFEGYIDISTSQPLDYSNTWTEFPDMGGAVLFVGSNGSSIVVTSISSDSLQMQVDIDGDGSPEYDNSMSWAAFKGSAAMAPSTPIADAGTDQAVGVSSTVTLNSTRSFDNNGDLLTYQWEIISGPAGHSATLTNPLAPNPNFATDIPGSYQIQVTVSDGINNTTDIVTISMRATTNDVRGTNLAYQVVDAEYSNQLDLIVMVSADPHTLHIFDPATGQDVSASLPLAPSSVSVAPDGLYAAIGHNGWISYIDLNQGMLVNSYPVSADVNDIVLAGNGYVYAFPRIDQWENIRSVELASGTETLHTGNSIRAGTLARLHPNGTAIYGADNGLSPSDIEKYSIDGGNAAYLYDSPYHGDYAMCGELWFSEDGSRIFTRCGNVFRSSSVQTQDMIYNGALASLQWINSLSHSSEAGQLAVIEGPLWGGSGMEDTKLRFFEDQYLAEVQAIDLPLFSVNGQDYPNHGRFVFFKGDGTELYAITQADPSAGAVNDHYIIQYSGNPWLSSSDQPSGNSAPVARAGADKLAVINEQVVLDGTASSDANSDNITLRWTIQTSPAGSATALTDNGDGTASFNPDVTGTYTLALAVSDGQSDSVDTISITVHAGFDNLNSQVVLNYQVVDAEYSDQLDLIVMVSADPHALHIFDPATGQDVSVSLPLPPSSVSVAPDGLYAAVGHNGWISYIDLIQGVLLNSYPASADINDIVLAGNGYVYAFPRVDQWGIRSVELASGTETLRTGNSIDAGTLARLHPNGTAIYGADNGLSPSDIEKYSIDGGNAVYLYDSPYQGDYAMCGELWFSEDGSRIFTRCGNVFRSSSVQAQDMIYNGALASLQWINSLSHSSEAGQLAVIEGPLWGGSGMEDTKLYFFEDQFLGQVDTVDLPLFSANGQGYPNHGRFVFFNGDGTELYAITEADPVSGALNNYAVVKYVY